MKLVYKCGHCGLAKEFDAPSNITPETALQIFDGYRFANFCEESMRKWIRHECAPGVNGIATLIAVVE